MDFEVFVLDCVKHRPAELDWRGHLAHAMLGLVGETSRLLELTELWSISATRPEAHRMLRRLERLEYFRALLYYQLDQRPKAIPRVPQGRTELEYVARQMSVQAGRLAMLINDWLNHGQWLDERVALAFHRFEQARARFLDLVEVNASEIWSQCLPNVMTAVSSEQARPTFEPRRPPVPFPERVAVAR